MTPWAAVPVVALLLAGCNTGPASPDPAVSHSSAEDACRTFHTHADAGTGTVGQEVTAWQTIHTMAAGPGGNQQLAEASAEVLAGLSDLNDARAAGGVRQFAAVCSQLGYTGPG